MLTKIVCTLSFNTTMLLPLQAMQNAEQQVVPIVLQEQDRPNHEQFFQDAPLVPELPIVSSRDSAC